METYKGYELWDHDIGPHQINTAERDPEWTDFEGRGDPDPSVVVDGTDEVDPTDSTDDAPQS